MRARTAGTRANHADGKFNSPSLLPAVSHESRPDGRHRFSCTTSTAGFGALLAWLRTYGEVSSVGVEGTVATAQAWPGTSPATGSWCWRSAGTPAGAAPLRRSDVVDAIAAGRAVLSGEATGTPKTHDGLFEALRALKSLTAARTRPVRRPSSKSGRPWSPPLTSSERDCVTCLGVTCSQPAWPSASAPTTTASPASSA